MFAMSQSEMPCQHLPRRLRLRRWGGYSDWEQCFSHSILSFVAHGRCVACACFFITNSRLRHFSRPFFQQFSSTLANAHFHPPRLDPSARFPEMPPQPPLPPSSQTPCLLPQVSVRERIHKMVQRTEQRGFTATMAQMES